MVQYYSPFNSTIQEEKPKHLTKVVRICRYDIYDHLSKVCKRPFWKQKNPYWINLSFEELYVLKLFRQACQ